MDRSFSKTKLSVVREGKVVLSALATSVYERLFVSAQLISLPTSKVLVVFPSAVVVLMKPLVWFLISSALSSFTV